MPDVDVSLRWRGRGLQFDASGRSGHAVVLDGEGGEGPTPVESLLLALAGCMAADLIDIGGKMRLPIDSVAVAATGERNPEPPRRYRSARLVFTVGGVAAADEPRLTRAMQLSEEKYCSVLHSLRRDIEVTTELVRTEGPGVEEPQ